MSSSNFHPALTNAAQAVVSDNRDETKQNIDWFLSEQTDVAEAWLMKAWTADSLEESLDCVQCALELEPNNLIAQAGMNWIQGVFNVAEEHLDAEKREQERLEAERLEAERLEAERLEQERLEAERLEQERLEAERMEQERMEQERLEQERLEQERMEQERMEAERMEAERLEAERLEQERLEAERLEQERLEAERMEAERMEQERLEAERLEQEQLEAERLSQEHLAQIEADQLQMQVGNEQTQDELSQEEVVETSNDSDVELTMNGDSELFVDDVVSIQLEQPEMQLPAESSEVESSEAELQDQADFVIPYCEEPSHDYPQQQENQPEQQPETQPELNLHQEVESLVDEVQEHLTPAENTEASSETSDIASTEGTVAGSAKPVILAVDDSATIRKLVSLTLREQGYEVLTACDGVEALKILAEQLPDLVLSDINMPRLGGYKLCKFIKKHERTASIPVVMLSGKDGVFDKMRGKMNGCDGFIAKPFETSELVQTLAEYLPAAVSE